MLVQLIQASSPSRNSICTPFSSSKTSPAWPEASMSAHLRVRAASTLRATCMSMAQGAALSVAPTKPSGVTLES